MDNKFLIIVVGAIAVLYFFKKKSGLNEEETTTTEQGSNLTATPVTTPQGVAGAPQSIVFQPTITTIQESSIEKLSSNTTPESRREPTPSELCRASGGHWTGSSCVSIYGVTS